MAPSRTYLDALRMLARRDLSEAQIRDRLARKGHLPGSIDQAVDRLREERAVDDARVAEAIARAEAGRKGHGRLRIAQALARAGIDRDIARRAADAALVDTDPAAQITAALDKQLRGRLVKDDAEFKRLYRYLRRQGFEADRALAALKARSMK